MVHEVGRFTFDDETGVVEGPAEYMNERGSARLKSILDGTDVLFNYGCHKSPNVYVAVLVSLQTDYAGWAGTRNLLARVR